MLPSIHPKQYQDVKANLQWYTAIVLALSGLSFFIFVLLPEDRDLISSLYGQVSSHKFLGGTVSTVLFGFVGWLLVFGLEIHDKVYDRYITRWRHYYDLDFILPTLVRPLTNKLDVRFFRVAADKKYEFMKPFYHFVADYEHEHKIRENLIVRFYEAVTKYWITQLNEVILLLFYFLTLLHYFVYKTADVPVDRIVIVQFIIAVLFLLNRYAVRRSRETVRLTTADEIEDIHDSFLGELENELEKVHCKFGLTYGESQN